MSWNTTRLSRMITFADGGCDDADDGDDPNDSHDDAASEDIKPLDLDL